MNIEGKIAVITGASSGIGEATAEKLAENGAKLVLAARREERLKDLKNKLEEDFDTEVLVVPTDVTDRSAVKNLVDQTVDRFGRLDILVNNAGLMPLSMMKNTYIDEWERMVDVNLKGVLYAIGYAIPQMREQQEGHIINVSSVAGRRVFPSGAVYCATKFGVTALSEGMRQELAPTDNIRTTSIEPGAVATELLETITDEDVLKNTEKMKNAFKFLESEDIANAIIYALSQPDHVDVGEVLVMPSGQA